MSAAVTIRQLSDLVQDLENWIAGLNDEPCTEDELSMLDILGAKLTNAATIVQKKTGSFRPPLEEHAWKASAELRSQAQSTVSSLISQGKLERPVAFRRNMAIIFKGPKDSEFDSSDVKSRKAITRQRCEIIRNLSPDGIVTWAASFTPSTWSGGYLGKDIFEYLVDEIEPDSAPTWPAAIRTTVQKLQDEDEKLQSSVEYGKFVQGE